MGMKQYAVTRDDFKWVRLFIKWKLEKVIELPNSQNWIYIFETQKNGIKPSEESIYNCIKSENVLSMNKNRIRGIGPIVVLIIIVHIDFEWRKLAFDSDYFEWLVPAFRSVQRYAVIVY